MDLIVYSPDIARIIDADEALEQVASGFVFTEGPVWDSKRARLVFSDIPPNRQFQWTEADGASLFREPTANSNGLTMDDDGNQLNCEHSGRRVSKLGLDDGSLVPVVSHYEGKRLNSPNDIVVHSSGALYFTDPPYGVKSEDRELDFQGVYRYDPKSDTLTLLVDDFDRPNGLAFNDDESVLYIDDTARQHVRAFPVNPYGTLGEGRVFGETNPSVGSGAPDGVKVDVEGNVYMTGPGGIWIYDKTGKPLGVIKTPEVAANLGWGDADKKTLFITATSSIYRVRTKIAGVRRF
ncbi:MAG: SMP-30/gluconolactonase/LRE family protein [Candidatus Poribacteria bacterium]|nr:SMP-30/gluconolactonase/LRE family protein [Candidatus Poribacteria bacterium]